jgi:hypothetical protein
MNVRQQIVQPQQPPGAIFLRKAEKKWNCLSLHVSRHIETLGDRGAR